MVRHVESGCFDTVFNERSVHRVHVKFKLHSIGRMVGCDPAQPRDLGEALLDRGGTSTTGHSKDSPLFDNHVGHRRLQYCIKPPAAHGH